MKQLKPVRDVFTKLTIPVDLDTESFWDLFTDHARKLVGSNAGQNALMPAQRAVRRDL